MNNPSYIANNPEELFDSATPDIQELIRGDEVNNATAILGKIYKIPVSSYVMLENIISFLLIGALKPEDAVRAIVDILRLSEEDAVKLAEDLDKSILEKARIKILGKGPEDMVELTFQEGRTPDELRKEILDTTKRESALIKEQASLPQEKITIVPGSTVPVPPAPIPPVAQEISQKKVMTAPGSRSQLLEQLQVLDSIPDDDEIAARLSKIQEQLASLEKKEENTLETKVPLSNFMFGEKGDDEVRPELQQATYSKAPTKYNVDPYRETADEI